MKRSLFYLTKNAEILSKSGEHEIKVMGQTSSS